MRNLTEAREAEERRRSRVVYTLEGAEQQRVVLPEEHAVESPVLVLPPPVLEKPGVAVRALDFDITQARRDVGCVALIVDLPLLEKPAVLTRELDCETHMEVSNVGNIIVLANLPFFEKPLVEAASLDSDIYIKPAEVPPLIPVGVADILPKPSIGDVASDISQPRDLPSAISATFGTGAPPEALLDLFFDFRDTDGEPIGAWRLYNCEGTTVVVYPSRFKNSGLDESLAILALELQRIVCGKSYDPKFLNINDDLDVLVRDEGVYVIRGEVRDRERAEKFFARLSGFQPKVVILSDDLYTPSKPSALVRTSPGELEALRLLALAYAGFAESASYCRNIEIVGSYDLLAVAKSCWYTEARRHLAWALNNAPHKLRPSVGGAESETHMLLKAIAIRHVAEVLGVSLESVRVEDEVKECGTAVPDLYLVHNGRRIAVDVKASVGVLPTNEIREAAEKYSACADEVWILLRPIAFLAFTRPIFKTLEHLQSGAYKKTRVVLPLYDKGVYKIVDIRDFLKALAERAEMLKTKAAP